jgi:hypothetical protein
MAFLHVVADDRCIYAVTGDGSLVWYRDDLRDGTNGPNADRGWAPGSGQVVGSGWDDFTTVFAAAGGILYGILPTGGLVWYRDTLRNGTNGPHSSHGWAPFSGSQVGAGWDGFTHVFSGDDGVIYAIRPTGELLWYRDDLRNGTNGVDAERGWAPGSGSQIGGGWGEFSHVFSGGGGVIYAVRPTGELLWYRDDLRDGTNGANADRGWAPGSGSPIGIGWSIERRAHVASYTSPLSVRAGDVVDVKLSATFEGPCTVQLVRLRENGDGTVGVPMGEAVEVVAGRQPKPVDAFEKGCGWDTTARLRVDRRWPSGLYSARTTNPDGTTASDAVFVVRPGTAKQDLLLVANTNTWNAYNTWGGGSNYSGRGDGVTLSFERPNPVAAPSTVEDGVDVQNHLTGAEIWISSWLEDAGYAFDTCSDWDLHRNNPAITRYKAVILTTHPEYWSLRMARSLERYVSRGGRVLYWGGNGVFRHVEMAGNGTSMVTGSSPDWFAGRMWADGPKPRTLLGVAYDLAFDTLYPQRCGFVVQEPDHPFFAGTGLAAGDVIGTTGRNGGGACGWEVDTATDFGEGNGPAPDSVQVLARGELVSDAGYTGHITYYEHPSGGWVFSIGSITFGGSLVIDPVLQQIARNALDACLAPAGPHS